MKNAIFQYLLLMLTRQSVVRILFMVLLFLATLTCLGADASRIVLVSSQDTKDSFYGRWLNLIYSDVFRQLGYEFRYEGYPGGRAPIMAEKGEVDGEIHRGADYEKTSKNLLRVTVSSFSLSYVAFAAKPGIMLNGWNSLKNTNYAVEYRRGAKVAESALTAVVKAENLTTISTVEQGLKKLISGRTDIYVDQEIVVTELLKNFDRTQFDPSVVYKAGILYTGESFLYLHKRHAAILPKIAQILTIMKKNGVIERYRKIAAAME